MLDFPYPNEFDRFYTNKWQQYALAGLTNPTVGARNLTWFDVNDFQAGDEIHAIQKSSQFGSVQPASTIENRTILKYLSRQDYPDSIVYKVNKVVEIVKLSAGNIISRNYSDRIIWNVIKFNVDFDKLPTESVLSNNTAFTYSMSLDTIISKTEPAVYSQISKYNDSCWGILAVDGCFPDYSYYKGLGGPYYKCSGIGGNSEENRLIYYKKASTTWGTPLVIKQPDYFIKNMFWTEYVTSMFGCTGPSSSVYFIQNDTVIDGRTYKQILSRAYSGIQPVYNFLGAIREENGKVFGKLPYHYDMLPNDEIKMYDFNLQAGDSVTTNVPYSQLSYMKATVSSIDTIKLLNGEQRKQFHLTNGDVWIEGIGSLSGFFTPFQPVMTCGVSHQLMCFVNTEEELYHNPAVYYSGACGKLSALENVSDEGMEILLMPNPVSDWVTVRFAGRISECKLDLFDINGRLVKQEFLNSFQNSVNLTSLSNGLYMYSLTEKGKSLKTGRLLKQ
jgi:hypothetical protein